VTLADLESYESSFKDPVNITLRNGNYTIYNPPPPSSGVVLDFILAILDGIAQWLCLLHRVGIKRKLVSVRLSVPCPRLKNSAF